MQCRQNEVSGFAVRNEQEAQNEIETKWNAFTASISKINPTYIYFSAQLMGGGVFEERNVGKQEIIFAKLFLLFNIIKLIHKVFLVWNGVYS